MDNLKDFTKAEFLSFLYAEKSREIENNSIPGWSKWALFGVFVSIVISLYKAIINHYHEFNYEYLAIYYITIIAILLTIMIFCQVNSNVRTYIPGKVRHLIEEAPVLSYIFQLLSCLICLIIQYYWNEANFVFYNLLSSSIINAIIVFYIIINRNRFVLAQLKTRVFINLVTDRIINYLLAWSYINIAFYLIQHYKLFNLHELHALEFEIAIGLSSLVPILYWLFKMKFTENKTAENIDRIIDRFIIGTISQQDAYQQYILSVYGYSIYQTVESDLAITSIIESSYKERKEYLINTEANLDEEDLSLEKIKTISTKILDYSNFYDSSLKSISKTLEKLQKILDLKPPAAVEAEFVKIMEQLETSVSLLSELLKLSSSLSNKISNHFYDNMLCKKYGRICTQVGCSHRKECMPIKYKITRWFSKHFPKNTKHK